MTLSHRSSRDIVEESSSEDEDFSASETEYVPSDEDSCSDGSDMEVSWPPPPENFSHEVENAGTSNFEPESVSTYTDGDIWSQVGDIWSQVGEDFQPRKSVPAPNKPEILANLSNSSTELDSFFSVFPKSLFMFISDCTNKRLALMEKEYKRTDYHEMMIVVGALLIMTYNRFPDYKSYWSNKKSRGNKAIKDAISRDRFMLLSSKMYFNEPEKPPNCDKLYYIEEIVNCFKFTFNKCRDDSSSQSIDESMAKFKGRSALKQYMPLKPIKRGIKIWERCDAKSGYVYDFNIYSGKEATSLEGTLGERVVNKLIESTKLSDISICFDRFFTSVKLMNTIPHAAVGTCMTNRKNVPKFHQKLQRGESYITPTNLEQPQLFGSVQRQFSY